MTPMQTLTSLGWNPYWQAALAALELPDCRAGRVVADYGATLIVATPTELTATVSGRLSHTLKAGEFPKIGDWVALTATDPGRGIIHGCLPRQSQLSRQAAGRTATEQVIAANVDTALVVQAANGDVSANRLDRYRFQLAAAGIKAVIVINKIDLVPDLAAVRAAVAGQRGVIWTSQATGVGFDELAAVITPGETAVLLGSSGVGKSSIINRLLGRSAQAVGAVREADSRGRHTTTHKQMFALPGGGWLIDTPGVRELQLWGEVEQLEAAFPDIESLAMGCKYTDCHHATEPGCNVQQAIASGQLEAARLDNYLKLEAELAQLAARVRRPGRHGAPSRHPDIDPDDTSGTKPAMP